MTLETTWFVLWGLLWAIYFMLDGFDLGMGTLMPFTAKSERDKRVMYNAQGPYWDGNEVWLITAGGVTFAAFPKAYAVMFSGFYAAMYLLLFALIFRGVTFELRNKIDSPTWRKTIDICHFLGSFLTALLLGVAFANIFKGLLINSQFQIEGGLFALLNPYGLLGGVFFVLMFAYHGAVWLVLKSEGDIHERAIQKAKAIWPFYLGVALLFLAASTTETNLYANYAHYPALIPVLLLPVVTLVLTRIFLESDSHWSAWACSSTTVIGVALFGVLGIYPALLPSSLDPAYSVTIANGASSPLTLKIMLGVALVCVPTVILYQTWVYKLFSGKVTDEVLDDEHSY